MLFECVLHVLQKQLCMALFFMTPYISDTYNTITYLGVIQSSSVEYGTAVVHVLECTSKHVSV